MWIDAKLYRKRDKLPTNHPLAFECATLSERQVTNLDEMAGLIDVAKYSEFERQRMMLRRRFEISRNFYIAHLLFYAKRQYLESMKILDEVVIGNTQRFLADYGDFKPDTTGATFEDNIFDFAVFSNMSRHYQAMEQTLRDAKRLSMMAKAEYILASYCDGTEAMVNDPHFDLSLVDNGKSPFWKQEMQPVLDKPVMIDVAWNFVDYQDILDAERNPTSKDESRPSHVQKQSSWFGGLFGQ